MFFIENEFLIFTNNIVVKNIVWSDFYVGKYDKSCKGQKYTVL